MATNIGTLSAKITATTSGLDAALRGAQDKLRGFGEKFALFNLASGGVSKAFDLITKPVRVLQDEMEGLDRVGKLSDRLGLSTESLIGLRHASDLAGVSGEELEMGLSHLSRKLGEATAGADESQKAFRHLGLEADRLATLPLDEALVRVADGIDDLGTQGEKSAVAFDLFGKSGARLLPLFQEIGGGMKEVRANADRLGMLVSREQIAEIERANDNLTRLASQWKGFKTQLAAQAGGPLADILGGMGATLQAITRPEAFGKRVVERFRFGPEGPREQQKQQFEERLAKQLEFAEAIDKETKKLRDQADALGQSAEATARWRLVREGAVEVTLREFDATNQLLQATRANDLYARLQASSSALTPRQQTIHDMMRQVVSVDLLRGARDYADQLDRIDDILGMAGTGNFFEEAQRKIVLLSANFQAGTIDVQEFDNALIKLGRDLDKLATNRGLELFRETRSPFENLASKLTEAQGLLAAGKLPGGLDTLLRTAGAGAMDLLHGAGQGEIGAPGALLKGSREAYSAIARAERNRGRGNPIDMVRAAIERGNKLLADQKKLGEKLLQEMQRKGPALHIAGVGGAW